MKNVIAQLKRILTIDIEIDNLIDEREEIPTLIQELRAELAKIEKENELKQVVLQGLEKEETDKKFTLTEERERFTSSEEKLKQATNNKEFAALQKEISLAKKNSEALQSDLESLKSKIADEKPRYEDWLKSVTDLKADLEQKIETYQSQVAAIEGKIRDKENLRTNEEGIMAPDLLKKYQSIKKRVSPAMSIADEGTCSECHTRIPPQLYIEIQKMTTMQNCPRCFRILYLDHDNQE